MPQKEIQEASYRYQKAVESKEEIVIGVNECVSDDTPCGSRPCTSVLHFGNTRFNAFRDFEHKEVIRPYNRRFLNSKELPPSPIRT